MGLYGPTLHVTPVDLCIIFQCNLYIYICCIMSCGSKIVSNKIKLFHVHSPTFNFKKTVSEGPPFCSHATTIVQPCCVHSPD